MLIRFVLAILSWGACLHAAALESAPAVTPFAAAGTVQYAFTPGDQVDQMIIAAIDGARHQVLVQAYNFSHRRIADALVRAHVRGVEVAILLDQEQSRDQSAMIRNVARYATVMIDSRHAAAHNKIMIIDSGYADCAIITGSFNFTYAAQHRNAENALVLRGNPPLCEAYFNNWRRHQLHAHALLR